MVKLDGIVFFDSVVLLGTAEVNQTKKPLQFIGYKVDGAKYLVATNHYDLSAEQIAAAYKIR